jgi:hypothetical protein
LRRRIEEFMLETTHFVEINNRSKAIEYYNIHRKTLPDTPELLQFDALIERIKALP